jgi:hypothetical protein
MKKDKKIKCHFWLEPAQVAALKSKSEDTGAPVAELVRRAINEYLKQKLRKR